MNLRVACFKIDVSAEIGQRLCGGLLPDATGFRDAQYARGIILDDGLSRVVLCAVDYCEIGGGYHRAWSRTIAEAAGTDPLKVALHTVHQHDSPFLRQGMVEAAKKVGVELAHEDWWKRMSERLRQGVEKAVRSFEEVSFVGIGQCRLTKVASQRRILDKKGRSQVVRYSVSPAASRPFPIGTIDPFLRSVTFWSRRHTLLASLNYYACHPQCSAGRGIISADAPGEALRLVEKKFPRAAHLYFTGCAGDVTMGKYTTRDRERNLTVMGKRLGDGMINAVGKSRHSLEKAGRLDWQTVPLAIPVNVRGLRAAERQLSDPKLSLTTRARAALICGVQLDRREFARQQVSRLSIGQIHLVHLPCEPFLAYQLYIRNLKPNDFVALAGLGDATVGYLPLAKNFPEGGYEVSPIACYTTPGIEKALKKAIQSLFPK